LIPPKEIMKIHYNFILYLVDVPEHGTKAEVADYIFSGNKKLLEEITKGDCLYVGKWRTGTLSKNGEQLLAEEGVSLEELEDGFMQVSNIFPYLQRK